MVEGTLTHSSCCGGLCDLVVLDDEWRVPVGLTNETNANEGLHVRATLTNKVDQTRFENEWRTHFHGLVRCLYRPRANSIWVQRGELVEYEATVRRGGIDSTLDFG
jgi:hypothetical protein